MAFYKKFQSKLNDLWYPKAIHCRCPHFYGQSSRQISGIIYCHPW